MPCEGPGRTMSEREGSHRRVEVDRRKRFSAHIGSYCRTERYPQAWAASPDLRSRGIVVGCSICEPGYVETETRTGTTPTACHPYGNKSAARPTINRYG